MRVKYPIFDGFLAVTIGVLPAALWREALPPHDPLIFGDVVDERSEIPEPWRPHPFERDYENPNTNARSADIVVSSTSGHVVKPPAGGIGFSGYPPTVKAR